jgi:hypothetical protein
MSERIAQTVDLHLFEFMALKWGWSYGDSNPRPLACHAHSNCRHMWLDVALCGVHLRLPWLGVA